MSTVKRTDRLSTAAERTLDPSSLVGSFFLSDHTRGWQGCIVAEPSPGTYLVEMFEWISGSSVSQRLVALAEMSDWTFYDSAEWMRNHHGYDIQYRWKSQRGEVDA